VKFDAVVSAYTRATSSFLVEPSARLPAMFMVCPSTNIFGRIAPARAYAGSVNSPPRHNGTLFTHCPVETIGVLVW
jgi:hypothetical protein